MSDKQIIHMKYVLFSLKNKTKLEMCKKTYACPYEMQTLENGITRCYFENRIPLKPALGGVCSLANYSVAYEETQSNRISNFRDFCVFFVSKGNPF